MAKRYDAIVIGTGQAGPPLAVRMADEGLKTAIIERKLFGGTCVNVGCTPTKTLVASARAAHMARRAKDFGVAVGGPIDVDMESVKARKDAIVRQSNEGLAEWLRGTENLTVYEGHARFETANAIAVNGETLEAPRIFLNVGAKAHVPNMPGLAGVPYLTNSTIMDVDFLPDHLAIVGGSYIGLEFAQMYRRFGSQVTVVETKDRLIPRDDEDVSSAVQEILEKEGVKFALNATCIAVSGGAGKIEIKLDCSDGSKSVSATHLLLAVGRTPNTGDLGLEKAKVEVDGRGFIKVDDELRTTGPGIWALGDCNGRGAFTHTSYNDYEIVAANLFDNEKRRVSDRIPTYALYIDPPLGRAGMSEAEARATNKQVLVGKFAMSHVGRARERSETQGFMKVLVDAESRRILGAALLGIEADEVVQSLLGLMYAEQPYTLLQRAMFIHPTVSEYLPNLVNDLEPLA